MSLSCKLEDMKNESDVEQKFLWRVLTTAEPGGLGFSPAEIYTKMNIRFLEIEKGTSKKVYRPDYIILIGGLPLITFEAKHPDDRDLQEALREARLYAAELNALHPSGINPCQRIVVTNGRTLLSSPSDSATVDFQIEFADVNLGSHKYAALLELLKRSALQDHSDELRRRLRPSEYRKATRMLGGKTARDEEVGYNEFGARLALDFLHVFNPRTREDRADVVRNAYVASNRREHYVEEIDRVIRTATFSAVPSAKLIEDTSNPSELLSLLGRGKDLQNKLFLLVGAVGSGKSTFIDYVREVKLDEKLKKKTVWVNVDLNDAPTGREEMERWVIEQIIIRLKNSHADQKLDEYEMLLKVFAVEIQSLRRGPLNQLSPESGKYREVIADELRNHLRDPKSHAKALSRFLCSERDKVLVLVLDNCDKGNLDEQLTVFQIVKWIQSWLKCLVFLPIRDVTYQTYRDKPPLDTVIKDFVFRIEAAPFGAVLGKRIQLALRQLLATHSGATLSYSLESGMKVVYPATEVGYYLACLYRSLYEHDRLLRRMLVGLSGKNIRKAMEIFLDFCRSGHIGGREILQIRVRKGDYVLPYRVVMRVLLRLNRRFYDGDESHVKNLFQCDPRDARPDHFVRLAILRWLHRNFKEIGPIGIKGFHRVERIIFELLPFGHDANRVRSEILYLMKAMCVVAEHQRTDRVSDDDLVCLSSAGFAHLTMLGNFDYLAGCSEDTWVSDAELAATVAKRIGQYGQRIHYSRETIRANSVDFITYLNADVKSQSLKPAGFLANFGPSVGSEIDGVFQDVSRRVSAERARDRWTDIENKFHEAGEYFGTVEGHQHYGVFVRLEDGPRGLVHKSKLPLGLAPSAYKIGDRVKVRVLAISRQDRHVSLGLSESQ